MTQITGKIYQMTNGKTGAALENRFPRTVMEAVLGLNAYLQQQFSSLADIYMPIEGITESLTGQEFVFRKSPASVPAKSLTLDRIQGKTRVWNQLIKNGNFADGATEWGAGVGGVLSVSGGVATVTKTATGTSTYSVFNQNVSYVTGHKYLVLAYVISNNSGSTVRVGIGSSSSGAVTQYTYYPAWTRLTLIGEYDTEVSGNMVVSFRPYNNLDPNQDVSISFKNVMCIDLTLLYGSEIDGLTDDEILAKFESEYPLPYYETNNGSLINNDASALETAEFNQWDEEWGNHTWNNYGNKSENPSAIGSNDIIPVLPETEYYIKTPYRLIIQNFTSSGLIRSSVGGSTKYITPSGTYGITFNTYIADGITTYNNDICINLSDPDHNGEYEPYRKSALPLNLGSFQVRNTQGVVQTITGGLKSAGSVRDEIVGNKYIKRIGEVDLGSLTYGYPSSERFTVLLSDAKIGSFPVCSKYKTADPSDVVGNRVDKAAAISRTSALIMVRDTDYTDAAAFKNAMSGVMLYYELATPEEYELVNPLVYTMRAGETEARVSPNADGLSAPFCANITYSAQENTDSVSSVYAMSAGRLYNSRKLWGRDFDGTADVSGALDGVTHLNSMLYLGSTNVGIGTASPAYKLDVAGTFRATGNGIIGGTLGVTGLATIAGGIKLTTSKEIWFTDNYYLKYVDGYLLTNAPIVSTSYITAGQASTSA